MSCRVVVALTFSLIGCGWPPPGLAPPPDKKEVFTSTRLGRDYALSIYLAEGDGPHPLLLVLDGYQLDGVARGALEEFSTTPGFRMPLVVGIYDAKDHNRGRTRDYTPVPCTSAADALGQGTDPNLCGGAGEFFDVVEFELLPYLESTYGVSQARADRAILGHSAGGLAAVYALFHRNHLFSRHLAGAPSLWFADGLPLTWPDEWAQAHTDLDATLWVGLGGWETSTITVPSQIFEEHLRAPQWPSLRYRREIIPAKRHLSVAQDVPVRAVRFAWAPP